MQRRITIAILAVAVTAVVLAGLGTSLLVRREMRQDTSAQLRDEAVALEPFVTQDTLRAALTTGEQNTLARRRLKAARTALGLVDASILVVGQDGQVLTGAVPTGADPQAVLATTVGEARSGGGPRLVWAAASSDSGTGGRRVVVVLTCDLPVSPGAIRWVLLSGGVVVVLAIVVAFVLARRITGPLREIDLATRRIAGGDLSLRLEEPSSGPGDELGDLTRSINQMTEALAWNRGRSQEFLMSVSHDLRTPLTSISGYAEAIEDRAIDDPVAAAQVIQREAHRLERLVADLLDLARFEARQFSLSLEVTDLADVVAPACAAFEPEIDRAGLALELVVGAGPHRASVDADRVAQVVANLLENAGKFAATTVRVEVRSDASGSALVVSDDGPGIAPEELGLVFDRHRTATPSAARPKVGTGLGLAIVRELAGAMGGSAAAQPGPGGVGTSLVVTFPPVRESPPTEQR